MQDYWTIDDQYDYILRGTCQEEQFDKFKNYVVNYFHVDDKAVETALSSPVSLRGEIDDEIKCIVEASMFTPQNSYITVRELVKHVFSNLKKLGEETVESFAFSADFNGEPHTFVIKTSRRSNEDLIHEIFVGFAAMNKVKSMVPNLMYTFGFYQCSKANVGKTVQWCDEEGDSLYSITEYIAGGPIGDYILKQVNNIDELMLVYIQVLSVLKLASDNYQFVHYDLHMNNILVRKFDEKVEVPIYLPTGLVYIQTNYVPYIIDYGTGYVFIEGRGAPASKRLPGIYPFSCPMIDCYKLLVGMGAEVTRKPALFAKLEQFYKFFLDPKYFPQEFIHMVPTSLRGALREIRETYAYVVRDDPELAQTISTVTYDDYINYILQFYRGFRFYKPKTLPLPKFLGEKYYHVDLAHLCRNLLISPKEARNEYLKLLTLNLIIQEQQAAKSPEEYKEFRRNCQCLMNYLPRTSQRRDLLVKITEGTQA